MFNSDYRLRSRVEIMKSKSDAIRQGYAVGSNVYRRDVPRFVDRQIYFVIDSGRGRRGKRMLSMPRYGLSNEVSSPAAFRGFEGRFARK